MSRQAPPPEMPKVAFEDHDAHGRVRHCVWHFGITAGAILGTVWLYTLHPILGIIAIFLAKHIVVAALASALKLPLRDMREKPPAPSLDQSSRPLN